MFSFYRKNISIERKHFYFTLSEQNAFLTVQSFNLRPFKGRWGGQAILYIDSAHPAFSGLRGIVVYQI